MVNAKIAAAHLTFGRWKGKCFENASLITLQRERSSRMCVRICLYPHLGVSWTCVIPEQDYWNKKRIEEGCHAFHPCLTKHAWHGGGHLDGTVSHMANHSSRAEVFSKGPGSNLKRGCLHRGQRPSRQKRPNSCWPRRDRHINSWVVTPSHTHKHTHWSFPCIAPRVAEVC